MKIKGDEEFKYVCGGRLISNEEEGIVSVISYGASGIFGSVCGL